MIDVDRMEDQLESAARTRVRRTKPEGRAEVRLAPPFVPAPAPAAPPPRPPASRPRRAARPTRLIAPTLAAASSRVLSRIRVAVDVTPPADPAGGPTAPVWRARSRLVEHLDAGELFEADRLMADGASRRDRLSWATMRALLDGNQDAARAKNHALHVLAQEERDREAMDRYWLQHFWLVATWGTAGEREELAEHCRDRAYRADDLQWAGALAVLLAQMGKADEAREVFEDAFSRLSRAEDSIQLDVATNLVEAAALLNDAFLGARLHYTVAWAPGRLATVGDGWICKGAIERFRALGEAAVGMFAEADGDFAHAVSRHRALGAEALLARTLQQWGATLIGRDDGRATECFREAGALADRLDLTDPIFLAHRGD